MKSKSQASRLKARRSASRKASYFQGFRRWELLIILAALVCDLNSWGHPFMLDDWTQIVENPILQSPANGARIFTHPYYQAKGVEEDLYRPLTTLSFALNRWTSGLQPDSFHIVNRLIHIVISLLVFWLLLRLIPSRPRIALITSLLFAVHPIQTEAITYIGGRGDAMAMLFFILAWFVFLQYRNTLHQGRSMYWLSLLFFFLALLSKESAVTWLGVALLTDVVYFNEGGLRQFFAHFSKESLITYTGFIAVVIAYLILRFIALGGLTHVFIPFIDNPLASSPIPVRLLTAMKVLFQSVALLFYPAHFSIDYSYNQIPLIKTWHSLPGLTVLAFTLLFLLALVWSYRRARNIFFGLAFFVVTYLVVSNLIVPIGTIRADRLLYMPALGVFLVAGIVLDWVEGLLLRPWSKWLLASAATVLLLVLAVRTVLRNDDWRDSLTLSLQTVKASPYSAAAHRRLGLEYFQKEEYDQALEQYKIAESIQPDYPEVLYNTGVLLLKQGKTEQAIHYLRRAVALSPDAPTFRHNLAVALQTQGDYAGAQSQFEAIIAYFDRLIRKDPHNPDTHFDKANALYFQGRLPEALEEYQRTLQIDPRYDSAKKCIDIIERKIGGPRDPR